MKILRTHTCRATGCQHVISIRWFMCNDHWRMVPAPLRRELVASHGRCGYDAREIPAYRELIARAVAAVEEKQERKAAGPSGSLFT